ncbi:MAG: GGDEF domain-containing protein [Spirochaetales bacterium]|nr:GGDEF domain-containing protein [Spirochaetales bacterium]
MKRFRLFGSTEMELGERITIIMYLVTGIVVCLTGTLNVILDYSPLLIFGSYIIGLICFILYIVQLFGHLHRFSRWFMVVFFILIVAPFFWIIDGGTNGGFQYFLPTYIVAASILLRKYGAKIVFITVLLNCIIIGVMIFIEYRHPEIIKINPIRGERMFDLGFSLWLAGFCAFLMIMAVLKSYEEERKKVERLTIIDDLTQAYNRRYANTEIQEEINRVERYEISGFSIILLDLDRFKQVNDVYGHDIGDQVLIIISDIIRRGLRLSDKFIRWGGEEFIIFLAQTDLDGAELLANRFRKEVEETMMADGLFVTFSAGISHYQAGDNMDSVIKRADIGLFQSKKHGRNQVVIVD